jgi:hypothetical protein
MKQNGKADRASKRIAFCHLDLGVGGAERFIIDSARQAQEDGHMVHMYTARFDPSRCGHVADTRRCAAVSNLVVLAHTLADHLHGYSAADAPKSFHVQHAARVQVL